jgi:hypothetical protein
MRRVIPILLLLLLAAAPAGAHRVLLTDGSSLEGEVLLLTEEHLILRTEFAGRLELDRERVAAIHFSQLPPVSATTEAAAAAKPAAHAGSGTLELMIQGDEARSSVRYQRDSQRATMLELNTLYLRVYSGGRLIHESRDADMDKEYRRGKWRVMRNKQLFGPVSLDLPAGEHRLQVVIGNDFGGEDRGGGHDLVSAEVEVENLIILPGEITRVVLRGKGGRLGAYGEYSLELLSSR